MGATIKDIAKRINVSPATVSLVLNNKAEKSRISKETRKKVLRAIQKVGYVPNFHVRGILEQNTFTIGMIATNIKHPAIALIVEGAKAEAGKHGHHVILGVTSDDAEQEKYYIDNFISRHVSGLVIIPTPSGETIEALGNVNTNNTPLVLCGAPTSSNIDMVLIDNEAGTYKATKYLIDTGHKRIVYCSGHSEWVLAKFRFSGYRKALEEYDIKFSNQFYVKTTNSDFESGKVAAEKILKINPKPDAAVFHNDEMAAGAMTFLLQKNIKIPEDISIVGYDNLPLSEAFAVPLTTVSIPQEELGRISVNLILERIAHSNTPQKQNKIAQSIQLSPELVIRKSTKSRL